MLKVCEVFGPTVQGEGPNAGRQVMFLRLSHCNLHCVWCDTPYTWNWTGTPFAHPDKFDPKLEVHVMTDEDIIERLGELEGHSVKSLVVSGGEPLLQQHQLLALFNWLKSAGWYIEVETNGTVPPLPRLFDLVDQFNCSPKLSNSGDPAKLRDRPKAVEMLNRSRKVAFKFVISNQQDADEVLDLVRRYALQNVWLMPLGKTPDELEQTRALTQAMAESLGFNFSDRLHVVRFGNVRAV